MFPLSIQVPLIAHFRQIFGLCAPEREADSGDQRPWHRRRRPAFRDNFLDLDRQFLKNPNRFGRFGGKI
jgi:hypothetical protein